MQLVSDDPRKSECRKRKRGIMDVFYDHFEAKSSLVMKRAEEVQASLSPEFPSFIKLMLRSHVTYCFWMGLPSNFANRDLPGHDETVVLEDESGEEYKTKFLAVSHGLSGGWRGFAKVKKLLEGDAVVFHLVRPCKFKVHIVRANDLAIAGRALEPVCFDARAEETGFDQSESETDQSENDTENLYSSDMEGYGLSGSIADFNNFNIIVNGLPIDHMLSQHTRTKYYDLCCTQKSYLHNHLLKSVDTKLAAEIVSKTITIADSIRAQAFLYL
ncbi:B3 domain-containing protein Os01g0234100 [Camellia lanceoleosa]|nr:B3 domain-containing protein Os01g0234100 [Camellia lanceoleosa]